MVAGTGTSSPSAIWRMVFLRILPERVLGRRSTTAAWRKLATAPISARTMATISATISPSSRATPAFSTASPTGTWPLSASATPITAHSATSGCFDSTSSMAPVERRWPAVLMRSSVRLMM